MQDEKFREQSGNFSKTRKVGEFCCVNLISIQSEHHNFENFLGELAPRPLPKQSWAHIRIQSWCGKVREFYPLWRLGTLQLIDTTQFFRITSRGSNSL